MTKPLIARAAFTQVELTDAQIAVVAGGNDMPIADGCSGDSWTFETTLKNNRPDTGDRCGDY